MERLTFSERQAQIDQNFLTLNLATFGHKMPIRNLPTRFKHFKVFFWSVFLFI